MKKIIKWTAATVGVALLAAVTYIALNSFDCEEPDLSKFKNPFETPSEADNVYFGLVAVTNVVNEKTGVPVLTEVFTKHEEAWQNFSHPKKEMSEEEKVAILAESAKVLSLFHEAVQRKTWCACNLSGKRVSFPQITNITRLCSLARLQAERNLELGKTDAAIESVLDMILLALKVERDAESGVTWLVASGVLYSADRTALKILRSGKATDEEFLRLQDALRQFDLASRIDRAERMLNNDCMLSFDLMTEMMATSELSKCLEEMDHSTGLAQWARRILLLIKPYVYHHNRTWTTYTRYLEKMKEGFRRGYDKVAWDKIEGEHMEICNAGWRFGPNFAGRVMLEDILPAWRSLGVSILNSSFQHSAVETIVAAALFKRKTGAFPRNLSELVPEYLPAVPRDPFTQGEEMKYDAARGIIWTVGQNGTFNGETVKPRADGKYDMWGKYGRENRRYVFNIDGAPADSDGKPDVVLPPLP